MAQTLCKKIRCGFVVSCAVLLFGSPAFATTNEGCTENVVEVVSQRLGDTRQSKLVRAPTTPLADFYSADAWEGSVLDRAQRLVHENSEIKLHKNVPFKYKGDDGVETRQLKTVLEISGVASRELKEKVAIALSRGVASFPMGEGGGHLTSRLGQRTFSWYGNVRKSNYVDSVDTSYSSSIEPIVALRASEELRLRKYVNSVVNDSSGTVGRVDYNGPGGESERLKTSNKAIDTTRGHNCTSWICTSPVGAIDGKGTRESLVTMTGAPLADEVHTNPGWWNFHLTGRANEDRVPLVIIWTKSNTDFAERMPAAGSTDGFKWEFSLH